ncbi:hypothetical protein I7I50_06065 [Histoplasma capsulatum G186AR]|nr:hypothetical protein I7I52_08803 [Histoplasma capsulatum]QSS67084.1 hypothetical protein I7I50_06065 [Histoplasma capsulatum G186AR]
MYCTCTVHHINILFTGNENCDSSSSLLSSYDYSRDMLLATEEIKATNMWRRSPRMEIGTCKLQRPVVLPLRDPEALASVVGSSEANTLRPERSLINGEIVKDLWQNLTNQKSTNHWPLERQSFLAGGSPARLWGEIGHQNPDETLRREAPLLLQIT